MHERTWMMAMLAISWTTVAQGCANAAVDDAPAPAWDEDGNENVGEQPPSTVNWAGPEGSAGAAGAPSEGILGPPPEGPPTPEQEAGAPVPDAEPPPTPDAAPPSEPNEEPPPSTCSYPVGPYGKTEGKVVSPNLSWEGFRPGSTTPTTVTPEDFFDCDGSRGITAVYAIIGTQWCSGCNAEAQDLADKAAQWANLGVVVVSFLAETSSGTPASVNTASSWMSQYGLQDTYVCADPDYALFSGDFVPFQLLIDPRTMTVVDAGEFSESRITTLASSNQ